MWLFVTLFQRMNNLSLSPIWNSSSAVSKNNFFLSFLISYNWFFLYKNNSCTNKFILKKRRTDGIKLNINLVSNLLSILLQDVKVHYKDKKRIKFKLVEIWAGYSSIQILKGRHNVFDLFVTFSELVLQFVWIVSL